VNHGRVEEEGNYQSLMAQKGLFYQMACRQIAE
jgi:ABC-type multidrug transport system fused ATPase/permease subunit